MHISSTESEVYGVRFVRAQVDESTKFPSFFTKLVSIKADICRVKVPVSHAAFIEAIQNCGLWVKLSNINLYNKLKLSKSKETNLSSDYRSLQVKSLTDEVLSIIDEIYEQKGWVSYNALPGSVFMTYEKQKIAFVRWIESYTRDQNKHLWLLYFKEQAIGLYSGHAEGNDYFGDLNGLRNSFRGQGHSKAFYEFIIDHAIANGHHYFITQIGLANVFSQRGSVSKSMVTETSHVQFDIFPFFSLIERSAAPLEHTIVEFDREESPETLNTTALLPLGQFEIPKGPWRAKIFQDQSHIITAHYIGKTTDQKTVKYSLISTPKQIQFHE